MSAARQDAVARARARLARVCWSARASSLSGEVSENALEGSFAIRALLTRAIDACERGDARVAALLLDLSRGLERSDLRVCGARDVVDGVRADLCGEEVAS